MISNSVGRNGFEANDGLLFTTKLFGTCKLNRRQPSEVIQSKTKGKQSVRHRGNSKNNQANHLKDGLKSGENKIMHTFNKTALKSAVVRILS
mgnify:CR=1 FL=1